MVTKKYEDKGPNMHNSIQFVYGFSKCTMWNGKKTPKHKTLKLQRYIL